MKNVKLLCLFVVVWGCATTAFSQGKTTLSEALERSVDSIFEEEGWKMPDTPGISFAILQNDKVIYQKNFGAADVENKVPVTSDTRFNLGHTAAHFTAYAILKLVTEQKIALDEDIRPQLASLKDFSHKVTVNDLLSGASGIYDYPVLMSLTGWNYNDNISQADVLRLVSLQQEAAFPPGTDYAESDTNFILLAELIAKLSGKSFKAYMEQDIFMPLGMTQTFVRTNTNSVDQNIAKAYSTVDGKLFDNSSKNGVYGIHNLYTTVNDLILWEQHLTKAETSNEEVIKLMNRPVQLNNGRTNSTSMGDLTLGQLYGHKERGVFSTYIIGSAAGHDSSIFKFPNQNYVAIALSNDGNGYNGYTGVIAAHRILAAHFTEPETVDFSTIKTTSLSNRQLAKFEGQYWDPLGELSREIKVVNDTLRYVRGNNNATPLIPLTRSKFQMKVRFDDKVYIIFPEDKPGTMVYEYAGAEPIPFEKYTPYTYNEDVLAEKYAGMYVNKDYGIVFKAVHSGTSLQLSNAKTGDLSYDSVKPKLFFGGNWFMRSIEFTEDSDQNITGFYVKNNAIRNLWFEKIE